VLAHPLPVAAGTSHKTLRCRALSLSDLLDQAGGTIASVTADGTYDGEPTYAASAVSSTADPAKQTPRDRHIRLMAEKGRMAWQKATGYGRRSLVETAIGRYKYLIGPKLCARSLPGHRGEVALAVQALNRVIRVAKALLRPHRMTALTGRGHRVPPPARYTHTL
jgi:hypothetical protein